jgi:hypothetical protein
VSILNASAIELLRGNGLPAPGPGVVIDSGGNAGGGGGTTTPTPDIPAGLTSRTPVSAMRMHQFYGIQGNPTRFDQPYAGNPPKTYAQANIDAWVAKYEAMGCYWVRARYNDNHKGVQRLVTLLRQKNMKVLWTTVPEGDGANASLPTGQTIAQTRTIIQDIAKNAADVTIGIEGLNEPNHNRNGAPVVTDWATNAEYGAVPHQKAIWEEYEKATTLSHVWVVSPSLQDTNLDKSYTEANPAGGKKHLEQMVNAGIKDYCHMAGQHSYPGKGNPPLYKYADRIGKIDTAFGSGFPVWLTEWGYATAPANTASGHAVATEEAAALYGPRAIVELFGNFSGAPARDLLPNGEHGLRVSRFEGLDDYDSVKGEPAPSDDGPGKDVVEANFGMWRVMASDTSTALSTYNPDNWSAKPEVAAMKELFDVIKAPYGTKDYDPEPVGLNITKPAAASDVRTLLAQTYDGTLLLFYWRNQLIMNTSTKDPINVPAVTFSIEDATGKRNITNADGKVRWTEISR